MGQNPISNNNEKLAPNLAKEILKLISGFLLLLGKPFFLVFFLIFFLVSQIINITGYLIDASFWVSGKINFFKNYLKIRKKSGVIFSASREQLKIKLGNLHKNTFKFHESQNRKLKKYFGKLNDIFWKTEVFLIASGKISARTIAYLKRRLQIRKAIRAKHLKLKSEALTNLRLFLLKLKLLVSLIKTAFLRIKIPKISWLKTITTLFVFTFLVSFTTGFLFWNYVLKDLPSPEKLLSRKQPVSTKIYDRNGILLYNIFKDQNRTPVKLSDIPLHVRLATIAIEDSEFYSHPGFSVKGIVRAFIKNYKEKRLTGGSTITQQLVKNALLTPEKTLIRKLKELTLAIKVELSFSKDEILEMYLNEVGYGGTAYGIQEAARTYFGKDVGNLNLAEAAFIAGLPKSPTEFSPFGTSPDLAFSRQKEVLNLMEANNFITSEQKIAAEKEQITFVDQKTDIKAPHFVMYVRQLLEEKYGKELIESGGLEIATTLDYQIQTLAEKVIEEEVEKLAPLNVSNAAAVILNPKTGEILAMVGSHDYFDLESDGNVNVVVRPRQPGSSIKVINYAYALSNSMNAATLIPDRPVTFLVEGQPPYSPKNYEGGFRGNLTLRSAFAESRNIPAVRVLSSYGVEKMVEMGQKMGITTWQDPKNYGLSLTLGGGEVKLLDLAYVYATVANYGKRPEKVSVLEMKNHSGTLYEKFSCEASERSLVAQVSASSSAFPNSEIDTCGGEQVLDARVAYLITDILKDNPARSPTFGSNSLMIVPNHKEVAVKTGTSNDLRDNLTVGYNQEYLAAVWVGNNDNSPMARIASGVTGATPIWNKIMTALLVNTQNHDWEIPEKLVKLPICPYTGTLSCQGCPTKFEWFLEENKPASACNSELFLAKEEDAQKENQEGSVEEEKSDTPPEIIEVGKQKKKKNIIGIH